MENNLDKEILEIIFDSLEERSKQTMVLIRNGLTKNIRRASESDFKKTNEAWGIVETTLRLISEGEQVDTSLNKETLDVISEALRERAQQTGDICRSGLTTSIREAAKQDLEATYKAWEKVDREREKYNVGKTV